MADKSYTVIGISLPDDMWADVKLYSDEWEANRSATLRRIILEWLKSQPVEATAHKNQMPEPAMIAA